MELVVRFNSQTERFSVFSNFDRTPFSLRLKCGTFVFDNAEAAFHLCKHPVITPELAKEWAILSPQEARYRGRKIAPIRHDWNMARVEAMRHILHQKFGPSNPELMAKLDEYKDCSFVHEAPWDEFWGTGKHGNGQNMMGLILNEVAGKL